MRIGLAQIRKYSPGDDIVIEMICFVYDKKRPADAQAFFFGNILIRNICREVL